MELIIGQRYLLDGKYEVELKQIIGGVGWVGYIEKN